MFDAAAAAALSKSELTVVGQVELDHPAGLLRPVAERALRDDYLSFRKPFRALLSPPGSVLSIVCAHLCICRQRRRGRNGKAYQSSIKPSPKPKILI